MEKNLFADLSLTCCPFRPVGNNRCRSVYILIFNVFDFVVCVRRNKLKYFCISEETEDENVNSPSSNASSANAARTNDIKDSIVDKGRKAKKLNVLPPNDGAREKVNVGIAQSKRSRIRKPNSLLKDFYVT